MTVILYLLAGSLVLGGAALALFLWSLRDGQFDDMEGAANRILFDDGPGSVRGPAERTVANVTDVGVRGVSKAWTEPPKQ